MSEGDASQTASYAGSGTRKLAVTVIVLAILPLLVPFPLAFIALKWILPAIVPEWSNCAAHCPPSTYGERLEWLLILGPSFLVAVASLLLGIIGIFRERRSPISPKRLALFRSSAAFGTVWVVIGVCLYGFIFVVTGIIP